MTYNRALRIRIGGLVRHRGISQRVATIAPHQTKRLVLQLEDNPLQEIPYQYIEDA